MAQARAQLSILGILKEALLTILRNAKILSSFILVTLLPLKLLCRIPNLNPPIVLHVASIAPSLLSSLSDSPVTINIFPIATIVSQFTTSIAVYLSTMCYNGSHLGLNELFSKFRRTCWGLLATIVVFQLFSWVYIILFSGFGLIFMMLNINNLSMLLIVLVLLFLLLLLGFVMCAIVVLMVGKLCLVVSIVEEKCYGWGAMRRATGLVVTRKLQGIVLMALMMGVSEIIAAAFARLKGDDDRQQQASASIVVGDVLKIVVDGVFTMLCSLVSVVFYYECKRSKGGGKSGEGTFQELLPFTSHVDDGIA